MRTIMLFLSFTLVLVSCKKDTDAIKVADSPQVYTNSNGTSVSLTNSKWVTTKYVDGDNSFGNVLLSLAGTTNADKVLIETYGDGEMGEFELSLDSKNYFKEDSIGISFMHFSGPLPTSDIEGSTKLTAIKGLDTLIVKLNSGKMKY